MTYTYHQHASGDFTINVVAGTKHCGINDDRCKFKYVVDIDYSSAAALDSNDFLLDNLDFAQFGDVYVESIITNDAPDRALVLSLQQAFPTPEGY